MTDETAEQRAVKAAMGIAALHFTENRHGMSKQTADVLVRLQRKLANLYSQFAAMCDSSKEDKHG